MPIPLPSQVTITGAPSWAATVQTAINAALNSPAWAAGSQTRQITLTAAQFSVAGIDAATAALLTTLLNEYRAAGYGVAVVASTMDVQQRVTTMTFEFSRFSTA